MTWCITRKSRIFSSSAVMPAKSNRLLREAAHLIVRSASKHSRFPLGFRVSSFVGPLRDSRHRFSTIHTFPSYASSMEMKELFLIDSQFITPSVPFCVEDNAREAARRAGPFARADRLLNCYSVRCNYFKLLRHCLELKYSTTHSTAASSRVDSIRGLNFNDSTLPCDSTSTTSK